MAFRLPRALAKRVPVPDVKRAVASLCICSGVLVDVLTFHYRYTAGVFCFVLFCFLFLVVGFFVVVVVFFLVFFLGGGGGVFLFVS